jgi:hypothetical protein
MADVTERHRATTWALLSRHIPATALHNDFPAALLDDVAQAIADAEERGPVRDGLPEPMPLMVVEIAKNPGARKFVREVVGRRFWGGDVPIVVFADGNDFAWTADNLREVRDATGRILWRAP